MVWGPIIGAAGSLLGGLFGSNSRKKQQQQQYEHQKEFAQKGIQWRVQDAKNAGIHPLYAMGAQTQSYQPSYVGEPMQTALENAGQHIGRAAEAHMSRDQRAINKTAQTLQLQNMQLQNDLLASRIARENQPGTPPPPTGSTIIDGQGNASPTDSNFVDNVKQIRTKTVAGREFIEPTDVPEIAHTRTGRGTYAPIMSKDAMERMEEDFLGKVGWNLRNRLGPMVGINRQPPYKAPEGYWWQYQPLTQDYELIPKRNTRAGGW